MYNKVIMIGNLTRDIELKYLPSGSAIAKGAIATSHKYKTQTGEQKDEVCFLDFTVFGKGGEVLNQYVRKGSKVMLEGRLVFEQWQAQDGTNRSKHALMVSEFKFLDSKADAQNMGAGMQQQGGYQPQQQQQQPSYNQQPQQQYNNQQQAPQQNNYNAPQQQQNGGMNSYEQNIPTIDIDNDEIPF
ncbi:MAG: single-stranded DNA-binding protein [Campylobacterota bacterium]|nr:single-stranded DNA-binding protein [Campylobacterota bacterium]